MCFIYSVCFSITFYLKMPFITVNSGESGLVYRGYINSGELVAVKTGKGNYHVTVSFIHNFNC